MSPNLIAASKLVKILIFCACALFFYKHSVFLGQSQYTYHFSNFSFILHAYNILKIIESVVTTMNFFQHASGH